MTGEVLGPRVEPAAGIFCYMVMMLNCFQNNSYFSTHRRRVSLHQGFFFFSDQLSTEARITGQSAQNKKLYSVLGRRQEICIDAHSSQARLREHHGRGDGKDVRPRERRGILCEMLFPGHDMGVALTNLQWLKLPAHHQCKIKLAKTLA